jgi:hypothetical protein
MMGVSVANLKLDDALTRPWGGEGRWGVMSSVGFLHRCWRCTHVHALYGVCKAEEHQLSGTSKAGAPLAAASARMSMPADETTTTISSNTVLPPLLLLLLLLPGCYRRPGPSPVHVGMHKPEPPIMDE